jgi:outer membrane lipoprotein-sorting protein
MDRARCYLPVGISLLTLVMGGGFLRAEETSEQVLAELKGKAESVESLSADMEMTTTMMGRKITMEGTMLFKKPRKTYVDMSVDMGVMKLQQIVISDGETVWNYQPTLKMASKIDVEKVIAATGIEKAGQNTSDITQPFQGLQPESIKLVDTKELDGRKVYVFEGKPQMAEMPQIPFKPAKIQVWVGDETGLLRKVVMLNEEGNEMMTQAYDNIQLNVEVPEDKFQFTPPEGVQVMELTEGTINMMKSMNKAEP